MKKKIRELLKKYQRLIVDCDVLIKDNKESMLENRSGRNKDWVHAELQKQESLNYSRRQCYEYFIEELKLLDDMA